MKKWIISLVNALVRRGYWCANADKYCIQAGEEEKIKHRAEYTQTVDGGLIQLEYFHFLQKTYTHQPKIWLLPQAFVHAESGGALVGGRLFVPSFANALNYVFSAGVYKHLFRRQAPQLRIEEGFLLTHGMGDNFFHFLIDSLPRILDYLHLRTEGGKSKLKLLLNYPKSFSWGYLKLLGIEETDCIVLSENALVERLYVANTPYSPSDAQVVYPNFIYSPRCFRLFADTLRKAAYSALTSEQIERLPRRVYVSRKDVNVRIVQNEEETFALLQERYGFAFVFLSELSIAEQIVLFSQLECVLTSHGAGLANLIYMQKGCLVELFPPNKKLATLYQMQQLSQISPENRHILFLCERYNEAQDVWVDLQKLQTVLDTLI